MKCSRFPSSVLLLLPILFALLAPLPSQADAYVQENLVSDIPGLGTYTDPSLKNPWGLAFSATSPFWVANNVTNVTTLYQATGNPLSLVVATPGGPTGAVFNGSASFLLSGSPARFIFATTAGTLQAWNPSAGTVSLTVAATPNAVYTGLAIGNNGSGDFLYAADNLNGKIDVFDSNFQLTSLGGNFTDPTLPAGYTPYNIQNIGGKLYVTYAQGTTPTPGDGIVDAFDTNGSFQGRLSSGGPLNLPWGITLAPAGFGTFGGDLLVGNFGDGTINAFDPLTGVFLGTLTDSHGNALVNSGLWSLQFQGAEPNTLFFTAGINEEADGLFGAIRPEGPAPVPEPSTLLMLGTGLMGAAGALRRRLIG